jgi:alkylation response protein AidB-like acyl-CoA dehydrogenase
MELTPEQRALAESVADLIRRHPPRLDPEGDDAEGENSAFWRRLAGIGVAGLGIPERFGGAGAGPVEVSVVAEQLGRALAPAPFLGSAVLAAQAILATGDAEECERLLPDISTGDVVAALAWTGRDGLWDPEAAACHAAGRGGGGWTLTGSAHYVLDGDSADVLIVAAQLPEGSVGLFEVEPDQPGVERHAVASVDQTRRLAVVRLATWARGPLGVATGEPVGAAALARARDLACIALSAEQAGAAAKALELTVEYTKGRVQFGRPIASFQAVQHRLAESHALVTSARSLAYRAAALASADPSSADLPSLAGAAKSYCSDVFAKVAAEMIQLHGAIGVTWEYDAHRYFKRAHGSAQLFGSPSAHLTRIADAIIGPAEPAVPLDDLFA